MKGWLGTTRQSTFLTSILPLNVWPFCPAREFGTAPEELEAGQFMCVGPVAAPRYGAINDLARRRSHAADRCAGRSLDLRKARKLRRKPS